MFKKLVGFILIGSLLMAVIGAWVLLMSSTSFPENKKSFFIRTGSSFNSLSGNMKEEGFIKNSSIFNWVAGMLKFNTALPGKYTFNKGTNLLTIIRRLKNGRQTPVNFIITKLRTKEDLAARMATYFESDSLSAISILNNNDSLAGYGLDTNSVMTAVIPNTYSLLWTTPASRIFKKLVNEKEKFWNEDRKQKAKKLGLTTGQVYTLASIVEEETNMDKDKGNIASVYLNRLQKGMKLAADPTVKFAMKDFSLKRIYHKHLQFPSKFNTYLNTGLPPGPICTPSINTIDAVLDAPSTQYLFFVAKPDLNGYSNFSTNYKEHMQYARAYQQALDEWMKKKESN